MQRHQLLVTPPQPAGKRVKRDGGGEFGGGGGVWLFGRGVVEGGGSVG